jgi:uncharacterized membrane protein
LLPAIVFGGLIALIVFLFIRAAREQSWHRSIAQPVAIDDGALAEARMRYARGEIGRDDFLRIAEDLAPARSPARPSESVPPASPPASSPPAEPSES